MSKVQGKGSALFSDFSNTSLKDRCESCSNVTTCNVCDRSISGFEHVGVRAAAGQESGIWHYASPCHHRNQIRARSASVKYGGGPLWKNGYTWQNIYWGPYFTSAIKSAWVQSVEKAVSDIELDKTYSAGLTEYNVGIGRLNPLIIIKTAPPAKISDGQIRRNISSWIASSTVPNLGTRGAYNIFLPPGVTVSLSPIEVSCAVFCDYHNTVNGSSGPFYTVEPYPCTNGCNHCTTQSSGYSNAGIVGRDGGIEDGHEPGNGVGRRKP